MMRAAGFWAVLAAAMICGCAAVSSVEPVGERPKKISQDEWGGTWINKDHPITIRVSNGQKGLLQIAWVEEKGGGLKLESYEVEIRESGEWLIGNAKEKPGSDRYYWGLVKKDEGQIIVWTPDPSSFTKLVQKEVLRGKVEKGGDVLLEKFTPEQLKIALSGDKGACFDWKEPVVFFRIGR